MLKKIFLLNFIVSLLCFSLSGMEDKAGEINNQLQLLVLNGASCAGKSSLARELIQQARQQGISRVYHMSFDDFYINLASSPHYFSDQKEYLESKGRMIFADPKVSESERIRQQYFLIFYEKILEKLERKKKAKKNALIITDICFSTSESFLDFLKTFKPYQNNIALIKVFCSYDSALQRLKKRNLSADATQHRIEWCSEMHYKQPQIATIYDSKEYDAGVNTSHISSDEAAKNLLYLFKESYQDDTFGQNYKRHASAISRRYNSEACLLQ